MIALTISGWLVAAFFIWMSGFLGKELLKKFRFQREFEIKNGFCRRVIYRYPGGQNETKSMKTIVIVGTSPFEVLVGFNFKIPFTKYRGTDWFGVGKSSDWGFGHLVIVSTYLSKRPVEFHFLIKTDSSEDKVFIRKPKIAFTPNVVCPPHFFQRLGLFV